MGEHRPTTGQGYRSIFRHTVKEDFAVYAPATVRLRLYAAAIDLALYLPLQAASKAPFGRTLERLYAYGFAGRWLLLWSIIVLLPLVFYYVVPTFIWGRSLGKTIVGLRVIQSNYNANLTFAVILIRETLGKALTFGSLGLGIIMAMISRRRLMLHDQLCRTQVISYRDHF